MSFFVDDINDTTNMQLDALQHAAEISCFIHERTLGPDLPEHQYQNNCIKSKTEDPTPNKNNSKTEEISTKNTKYELVPFFETNLPDANALECHLASKKLSMECKRNIRKQLAQLQEKHNVINALSEEKQHALAEERQKWLAEKRRTDAHILQKADLQANADLQQHARQLENLRKQTQHQLQAITFQGIIQYQTKFRKKYESIAKMFMLLDKDAQQACGEHNRKLRELVQMFEQLIAKIKSGNFGPKELQTAEKLCNLLGELEENIVKELANFTHQLEKEALEKEAQQVQEAQQQAQQAQQAEEEKRQKLLLEQEQKAQNELKQAAQQAPPPPPPVTAPTATVIKTQTTSASAEISNFVDPRRLEFYNQINRIYHQKVESVKPLQSDESMKKYRTNCQKAINIPLNAISSVSSAHLRDKFEKLYNFISGQPYKTAEAQITVNDHPLARDYCILLMAKKFVTQAETAISSNPQAAFPIASVIVSLWKLVPDFGKIFLAYVFKESPFMVPFFIPQQAGQPLEEYFKLIGYRLADGNQLEKPDMYLKRQAGIGRLYAAIMITSGRQLDGPTHPYGIAEAWVWLTHVVLLPPLPDVCATLIMEMLQIVGSELWRAYGRQFVKLLIYIQQYYLPRLTVIDEGGPKTRLELLMGKFLREGQIPQPTGILPQGFW